ncbi:MAG: DNA translocase FtsK 4TM domain-containing protein [Deltaproteobacteria bacterium]|nr:DNA translocase FtsK 4TM domain-containing protein [Deltaproteobacteria bacterium]
MGKAKAKNGKKRELKAEIIGIIFAAMAALFGISLVLKHSGSTGMVGLIGNNTAEILFVIVGFSAYVFPIIFAYIAFECIFREGMRARVSIPVSMFLFIVTFSGLFSLLIEEPMAGGIVGHFLTFNLSPYLGTAGTFIVFAAIFLISLRIGIGISLIQIGEHVFGYVADGSVGTAKGVGGFYEWLGGMRAGFGEFLVRRGKAKEKRAEEQEKKRKEQKLLKEEKAREATKKTDRFKLPQKKKPTIVTLEQKKESSKAEKSTPEQLLLADPEGKFQLPNSNLLDPIPDRKKVLDNEKLLTNSKILEKKLQDFGVLGQVKEVRPGPVVTMYEFEPAPGIKVGKITNLADDLALAMRAESLRILAPVPGKAVVGIEVPNETREDIYFREVIESEQFRKSKGGLPLVIGKDLAGMPFVADLATMPHLLIAGATGSGKSVFVNSIILSILFKCTPEDVRFLMIDPKMLELSAYEGIPHLITPVVTESKRGAGMLRGIVVEMEKRYKLMSELGARNIIGYNELVVANPTHSDTEHKKLPYIVVIIDELADLMMTAGKDVEDALVRLSQMARAAGIHLLVATQRPSVDVITGLIKTNFPARISFQVPSRIDSRTILDSMGAESLLGRGDMLFMPPGTTKLKRAHGAYVSEAETKRLTDFLRKQGKPLFDEVIAEAKITEKKTREEEYDAEFLKRYNEAVELAGGLEMISTSYIQRRFRIGYNTAARLIEKMEEDGVVGPAKGSKPREVLRRSATQ